MNRRSRYLLALILLVASGTGAFLVLTRDDPATGSGGLSEVYGPLLEAKEALLATPHEVDLDLSVDIPEFSEVDNPDHQEISAGGTIDLSAGDAQLVYDYQGLANAGGFLGHFDTMDAIYVGGTGYLKIFGNGPPWLSIEPADATNDEVQRLRDVMLTTPMILPGLLEAAASSPLSSHELSREVTPSSLASMEDELAAGIGEAFEELEVASILVEVTLNGEAASRVEISFGYQANSGGIEVRAAYELTPTEEELSVDTPDSSDVRTFSSIVG